MADYTVSFEQATVALDGNTITISTRDGEKFVPQVESNDFYEEEIRYFVETIVNNSENTENPPETSATTIKLVETLRASARKDGEKLPFRP